MKENKEKERQKAQRERDDGEDYSMKLCVKNKKLSISWMNVCISNEILSFATFQYTVRRWVRTCCKCISPSASYLRIRIGTLECVCIFKAFRIMMQGERTLSIPRKTQLEQNEINCLLQIYYWGV